MACATSERASLPIALMRSRISASDGGSWPSSGISLAMFTHWSPMRSMWWMTCSSAATSRRSPATGACVRQQGQDALVHLEVAAVDAVVVGDDQAGQLDVLVLERLDRAVERRDDHVEPAERLLLEPLKLLLEVDPASLSGIASPTFPVTYASVRSSLGLVKIFSVSSYSTTRPVAVLAALVELDREERRPVRDARRLLHVVRDDDDRVLAP